MGDTIKAKWNNSKINTLAIKFKNEPNDKNFTELINNCKKNLRDHINSITHDDFLTDEVYSDIVEILYYELSSFDESMSNFTTWLYRITVNTCLTHITAYKNKRSKIINVDISDYWGLCDSIDDGQDCCCDSSVVTGQFADNDDQTDITFDSSCGKYEKFTKERIVSDIYEKSVSYINKISDTRLRTVMLDRYIKMKKVEVIAADNDFPLPAVKYDLRRGVKQINDYLRDNHRELYTMYLNVKG